MNLTIRLSVLSLFLVTLFSMPALAQEKSKSDKLNTAIAKEYNQKMVDVSSVIKLIAKKDSTKAEEIKTYAANNHIPLSFKLPKLSYENGYLVIKDEKLSTIKFKAIRDTLFISYQDKTESVQFTTSVKDAAAIFDRLLTQKTTFNIMDLVISPAHADGGVLELVGMAASGIGAMVMFGALGVMDTIDGVLRDIAEIPNDIRISRTLSASEKMCNELVQNKQVKNIEKMIKRVEDMKKREDCDLYPNLAPGFPCLQADERLKCLKHYQENSAEVSNTSRGTTKESDSQNPKESKEIKKSSTIAK